MGTHPTGEQAACRGWLLAAVALAGFCLPAVAAAGPFARIPRLDGKRTKLELRIVKYTGGSTGRMVVDVRNTTRRPREFDAKGLYFVPDGDAEKAPQRLGAAGAFEVDEGNGFRRRQKVTIAPGRTLRLKLQVFCLDSHRSSPSASQGFSIAKKRLPKKLRREIMHGAKKAAPRASENGAVQGYIWKTRNKKWIKLEGERKREKSAAPEGAQNIAPQRNIHRQPLERQRPQ